MNTSTHAELVRAIGILAADEGAEADFPACAVVWHTMGGMIMITLEDPSVRAWLLVNIQGNAVRGAQGSLRPGYASRTHQVGALSSSVDKAAFATMAEAALTWAASGEAEGRIDPEP